MKRMSPRKFMALVRKALDTLPPEVASAMENVVIDVEDEPDEETLRGVGLTDEEIAAGETLYGLFEPMDLPQTEAHDFLGHPHRIVVYKHPLEDDFPDPRDLWREVRMTVVHELAHHFGWSEADLERFEAKADPFGDD